ncbi:hypothetical protein [Spirosoma sp. KUDC1026]|uniref:hypothetical protein n=1 Tax=Spirosoma sp. KUDC1026 TaxID=2745947 RepID=UPI00159B924A|nr:hypothetical protein [Spirosoma sp. KUDC1026]QKZ13033.1 hypothetical protein HU175_10470 [Spirosoma sp. KUDC1026]
MEKKRRITFYTNLNGPHEDQIREQVAMTPEERWQVFLKLRRMYYGLVGDPPKLEKSITVSQPSWM